MVLFMNDLVPVRRALLSVSDKTGLVEFARALSLEFAVELVSTGGTAKLLRDAGLKVRDVSELTGFPEMMDGRVKTLHPNIHGGILALRDDPAHVASMASHNIQPIDLVCVNLYPFAQTIADPNCTFDHAIENIDIGGPGMIRAAAKNHRFVLVVSDPSRYEKVLGDLREHAGSTCGKHRLTLAQRAYAQTADYDSNIAKYLATQLEKTTAIKQLPDSVQLHLTKRQDLRYGENPHQLAAVYTSGTVDSGIANAKQLAGKELSYINLLDAEAAVNCVSEFTLPAACIVKHATPCGIGTGNSAGSAFAGAYESDALAAFGGVVAFNVPLDDAAAAVMVEGKKFVEVIVAPSFSPGAIEMLTSRWKNARLLQVTRHDETNSIAFTSIGGGVLVQQRDTRGIIEADWKIVSDAQPTPEQLRAMKFAWLSCKHVKSNAIVIASTQADGRCATVGIGGGQVDRVGAAKIAISKAGERCKGASAASDAFFPFDDGTRALLDAGVRAIIQPGGSVRDADSIKAVNDAGAVVIFTGTRHFRH